MAYGDVLFGEPEIVDGDDFLAFIGVPPARHRVYPRESHLAEKIHAYTLPRPRENSRVKDLADIALLALAGPYDALSAHEALHRTFRFRDTHPVPDELLDPPDSWAPVYARMAAMNGLTWPDLATLVIAARAFAGPILTGQPGQWDAAVWIWR